MQGSLLHLGTSPTYPKEKVKKKLPVRLCCAHIEQMSAKHYTTKQACERAKVSRFALTRAQKAGDLFAVKDNKGRWLWDVEALNAWAAEKPEQTTQKPKMESVSQERLQTLAMALGRAEGERDTLKVALEKAEAQRDSEREKVNDLQTRSLFNRIFNN